VVETGLTVPVSGSPVPTVPTVPGIIVNVWLENWFESELINRMFDLNNHTTFLVTPKPKFSSELVLLGGFLNQIEPFTLN
jgi:hypothetical protein